MQGPSGADRVQDPKGPDHVQQHHERGGVIGVSTANVKARGRTMVLSNCPRKTQNPNDVGNDECGERVDGVQGKAPAAHIGIGIAPRIGEG